METIQYFQSLLTFHIGLPPRWHGWYDHAELGTMAQTFITRTHTSTHTYGGMIRQPFPTVNAASFLGQSTFYRSYLQVNQSQRQTPINSPRNTHPLIAVPLASLRIASNRPACLFGCVQVQTCLLESAHFTILPLVYHTGSAETTSRAQIKTQEHFVWVRQKERVWVLCL